MNKLVYLYLENLPGFAPLEINFSNDFVISYDGDDMLTVQEQRDLIGELYGPNILDINIIAGQNGVGKSTLLKAIAAAVREKDMYNDSYDYRFIQVIATEPKHFKVYTNISDEEIIIYSPEMKYEFEQDPTYEPGRTIVYYSPFLDFNVLEMSSENKKQPVIDLSLTQRLMDDIEGQKDDYESDEDVLPGSLLTHKVKNIQRQLRLVKAIGSQFKIPFDIPQNFWISFHRVHPEKDDLSIPDNALYEDFQSQCARFLRESPENGITKKTMARLMYLRNLISLYFRSINKIKTQTILSHRFEDFEAGQVAKFSGNDGEELVKLILSFFRQQDIFDKKIFDELIAFVFEAIEVGKIHFSNVNNVLGLELDLSNTLVDSIFAVMSTVYKDDTKHVVSGLSGFISFDWSNVSSGQKMFLDLFSRLYDVRDELLQADNPVLMIIDEGEMGFHPEWQIRYIETLVVFFNKIMEDNDFQLLLATHSPLILSDFPNERVHLLKVDQETGERVKTKSMGTFAQNTAELLANEFFVETSLIGNFAKRFIDDILAEIGRLEPKTILNKQLQIREKIKLIDEPVIAQLLFNELERKLK